MPTSPAATTPASTVAPLRVRVAGFWRRTGAGLVDAIVLSLVFLVLQLGVAAVLDQPLPRLSQIGPDYLLDAAVSGSPLAEIAAVVFLVVVFTYFFVFHATQGQTLGKRLFRIRVIDAYGARPTFARTLVRTMAYAPSALLLTLGFVWIGVDREKRGLHDWLADTYVIVGSPHTARA